MPALTSEKLEKIVDEKLRPISDLSLNTGARVHLLIQY